MSVLEAMSSDLAAFAAPVEERPRRLAPRCTHRFGWSQNH